MKGERDERARALVLEALAQGRSVTAAAKAAGVARTTPYQWAERGDDQMREALERRGKPTEGPSPPPDTPAPAPAEPPKARKRLHKHEREAIRHLLAVARGERDGEKAAPGAHVAAAKALLEHYEKRRASSVPKVGPGAPAPEGVVGKPRRSREELLRLIRGGADGKTG